MDCLKCGKPTKEGNVFCPECLAVMDRYPVRQDTAVVLPQRKPRERRNPAKKPVKPEELIVNLQNTVKRLWIAVAVLVLLLSLSGGGLAVMLYQEWTEPEMGSNYSTYAPTETTQPNP